MYPKSRTNTAKNFNLRRAFVLLLYFESGGENMDLSEIMQLSQEAISGY